MEKVKTKDINEAKKSLFNFIKFLEKLDTKKRNNYFIVLKNATDKYIAKSKKGVFPYNSHGFISEVDLEKLPWDFLTVADKFILREQRGIGLNVEDIINGYKVLGITECELFGNKPSQASTP